MPKKLEEHQALAHWGCWSLTLMPPKPSPEEAFITINHGQKGRGETITITDFHIFTRAFLPWLGIIELEKAIVNAPREIVLQTLWWIAKRPYEQRSNLDPKR